MNVHRDFIKRLRDAGRWFLVSRDFLLIMGTDEALVLSHLCNVGGMEKDDWFRCGADNLMSRLNISLGTHDRVMKQLEKRGFIRREMRGLPAKRYVYIEYDNIEAAIEKKLHDDFMSG